MCRASVAAMTDTPEPFLHRDGDAYLPTQKANGWWREGGNLHARVMIGLFAHVIEQQYGEPEFQPARLTADLYRLPDLSPLTVTTRIVRQGGRIKVVEAELFSGGVSSARASCQLLRRGQQPEAPVWARRRGMRRRPNRFRRRPSRSPTGGRCAPSCRPASSSPTTCARPARAAHGCAKCARWSAASPITPFSRVATGVDYTSPIANGAETGLDFINSDVTLYLHREPVGEWIGYEVADHQSAEGIAVGHCRLHDVEGPVGFSSCAALAQRKR